LPIAEFQLPISNRKSKTLNLKSTTGLVGYNYILKKEQQKKPLLELPAA